MNFPKKTLIILFAAAMVVRLLALASLAEEKSLLYVSDSLTYLQVGKNLLTHGVYSMEISPNPHPDNFRTPLYPLFLIPFIWLKTSLYIPALVQTVFMSLGILLFFILSQKIFSKKEALIAAAFFALEPFTALIGGQIMTESIFVPLFVTSLLLFAIYIEKKDIRYALFGSLLLALSALTRPISFYLFVMIPLAVFFSEREKRIMIKHVFLSLAVFFTVVSPWLLFNAISLHTIQFSSVSDMQFYAYHGKYFDEWRHKHGAAPEDKLEELSLDPINNTFNARAIPPIKAVGVAYIKAHWPQYGLYHILRIPSLYTDSGYASILNGIPFLHFNYDTVDGGFFDQLFSGHALDLIRTIPQQPVFLLLFLADLLFVLMAMLCFLNPVLYYVKYRKIPSHVLWLILVLGMYTVLSSPIGGARFRIPINPILCILAINSLTVLRTWRTVTPSDISYDKS